MADVTYNRKWQKEKKAMTKGVEFAKALYALAKEYNERSHEGAGMEDVSEDYLTRFRVVRSLLKEGFAKDLPDD